MTRIISWMVIVISNILYTNILQQMHPFSSGQSGWVAHYELAVLSLSGRMVRAPVTWSHEVSSMKKVR